ncbi:MAG TPA: CHAT domain-containing protein [Thermoanaerobaculia bacterium]|nr:CHAT domain-containing protein [Thermoanaerobaculia bacterium]
MKNSQKVQITGSTGVSIGDVSQTLNDAAAAPHPEPASQPVRILFLASNPEGTSPLRLDREVRAISEGLSSSRLRDRFELQQIWAAGDKEIQDGLLLHQPDILHLSGHGSREGRLLLEREGSMRDLGSHLPAATSTDDLWLRGLVRVVAATRGRVRCVVLNACHSETVARALAQVTGCVVGMSDSIGDAAAIRFSWSFYNALGHGLNVKAAFDAATGQIAMGGWPLDSVPSLVAPGGVDPAGLVFG